MQMKENGISVVNLDVKLGDEILLACMCLECLRSPDPCTRLIVPVVKVLEDRFAIAYEDKTAWFMKDGHSYENETEFICLLNDKDADYTITCCSNQLVARLESGVFIEKYSMYPGLIASFVEAVHKMDQVFEQRLLAMQKSKNEPVH